jgi:hypothetical protein
VAQIYNVDQLAANRGLSLPCCCEAARQARNLISGELDELRRSLRKPMVLCLEQLEAGIPATCEGWDLIYSTTLFSGLPSVAATQVVKTAVTRLKPGGRLLISNIRSQLRSCPRCPAVERIYRSELEMAHLASGLASHVVVGQSVFRDRSGLNAYLELYRTTSLSAVSACEPALAGVVRAAV